jgi:hypothetical protein
VPHLESYPHHRGPLDIVGLGEGRPHAAGTDVPDNGLDPMVLVELCHVVGLLGLLCQGTKVTHSSRNHGRDGSPSLLPHHARWIDVVDIQARSPLAVSGALHGLGGERAKAPSTPRTIPGVGFERPLQFFPMV